MIDTLPETKTLPHSLEAERAVLAAVLLDPGCLPIISGRLKVDDIYSERHRLLYQALLDLQEDGVDIDLRTLQANLEQKAQLDAVGGIAYIAELDLDLPDIGRVETYAELIKERSVRRRLIQACGVITRDSLDGGLPAEEALGNAEKVILGLGEEAIRSGFVPIGEVFDETLEDLDKRPGNTLIGIPTGFFDFDRITQGLNKGNLIIIAGRPGMGKTSLALNIAQHAAFREGRSVGMFSLEMSAHELSLRVLCSEADVNFGRLRSGHLSDGQWSKVIQAVRKNRKAQLYIDDSANQSPLELASKVRRLKAEKGMDLMILDYLQLMGGGGGKYENRNLEIAAITRGLKQLAKELEIPVICLSQLSRQTERRGKDHRPQLADLRESGSIEQDADMVAFVYRDEVYNQDDPENKGLAELIIAKHRNGETGTIPLVFLGGITSFRNLSREAPPNPGPM